MNKRKKKRTDPVPGIPARFFDLPLYLRLLIINISALLILTVVFFMAGKYLYSPQGTVRTYVEACLAGDWNQAYDCCEFPDSPFLSRKNYVNAMTFRQWEDYSPNADQEIKNFMIRRKTNQETNEHRVYEVNYTLRGVSESRKEIMEITRGAKTAACFYEWFVVPDSDYVRQVRITVPADADFCLDGTLITEKYQIQTAEEEKVYQIPYLFLGAHTVEIVEPGTEGYREIIQVTGNEEWKFLPRQKLNDSTGEQIANRVEEVLDEVFTAASAKASFTAVKEEFSADSTVQEKAREAYEQFSSRFADSDTHGITTLAVTGISTAVSSTEGQMKAEVTINGTIEESYQFLLFFNKTRAYNFTWQSTSDIYMEKEHWVLGDGLLNFTEEE
ncbi:MAG: hypothetical protein MR332_03385 [Fusicatenibacter sp.]|nr:hypothetical protein [Fusicatenibacter sp.]